MSHCFCAAVMLHLSNPFSIFICGILCLFWLRGKLATSLDGPNVATDPIDESIERMLFIKGALISSPVPTLTSTSNEDFLKVSLPKELHPESSDVSQKYEVSCGSQAQGRMPGVDVPSYRETFEPTMFCL